MISGETPEESGSRTVRDDGFRSDELTPARIPDALINPSMDSYKSDPPSFLPVPTSISGSFALRDPVEEVEEQMHADRMPVGVIMPILSAIGLAVAIKWRNAQGAMGGLTTALIMAILFALPVGLYSYVYGSHTETFVFFNLAHFLICWGAAGALLGAWK